MKPIEICKGIYWVGCVDWNIRDFHGYSTDRGTTYNSYLIVDDTIALIDSVKHPYVEQQIDSIRQIIDPQKIDLVISNHSELDHSGGLPRIMQTIGMEKPLYCSKMGQKHLQMHFKSPFQYNPVSNLQDLSLGNKTLQFIETRMLHWPDSMFTYAKEDQILFSSDAFGQHYAGQLRFDDEIGDAIMPHAKKYYANILMLYAPLILKLVKKVNDLNIPMKMICPDHGIIWRQNPNAIIEKYVEWSNQAPKNKALVVYDTMWHSTEKMAHAIVAGLTEGGTTARVCNLRCSHRSDILTDVLDAGAIMIGSPTLNNGLYPTVSDFMTYLKGLKPQNKIGVAFGSYGWSGEATKLIHKEMESMKFDMIEPALNIQYVPDKQGIESCYQLGLQVAKKLENF